MHPPVEAIADESSSDTDFGIEGENRYHRGHNWLARCQDQTRTKIRLEPAGTHTDVPKELGKVHRPQNWAKYAGHAVVGGASYGLTSMVGRHTQAAAQLFVHRMQLSGVSLYRRLLRPTRPRQEPVSTHLRRRRRLGTLRDHNRETSLPASLLLNRTLLYTAPVTTPSPAVVQT